MCLCMIDKRYKPSKVIREAWKCFNLDDAGNLFPYWRHEFNTPFKQNDWIRAQSVKVTMGDPPWPNTIESRYLWNESNRTDSLPQYDSGFHVFEDLKTALRYGRNARRVFVRGIRLIGREYGLSTTSTPIGPIYVTDELFIPSI